MSRSSGTFIKGHVVTKETCEKIRQSKIGCTPWNKGKFGLQVAWNKDIPVSEEQKEKQRIIMTGRTLSEETRKKMSENRKGKIKSEKTKQRMRKPKSELTKERMSKTRLGIRYSEETIRRMSLSKYDVWYGGVKHHDTPQYCEKWTRNLRERVRVFFDYKCVSCGTAQNGRKLHVHHVNYNKNTCCDDQPRLLVALCTSCHISTNNHRKDWEKIYTDMIQGYYEGRCFLTEREMKSLNPTIEKFNYMDVYNHYQGIDHEN